MECALCGSSSGDDLLGEDIPRIQRALKRHTKMDYVIPAEHHFRTGTPQATNTTLVSAGAQPARGVGSSETDTLRANNDDTPTINDSWEAGYVRDAMQQRIDEATANGVGVSSSQSTASSGRNNESPPAAVTGHGGGGAGGAAAVVRLPNGLPSTWKVGFYEREEHGNVQSQAWFYRGPIAEQAALSRARALLEPTPTPEEAAATATNGLHILGLLDEDCGVVIKARQRIDELNKHRAAAEEVRATLESLQAAPSNAWDQCDVGPLAAAVDRATSVGVNPRNSVVTNATKFVIEIRRLASIATRLIQRVDEFAHQHGRQRVALIGEAMAEALAAQLDAGSAAMLHAKLQLGKVQRELEGAEQLRPRAMHALSARDYPGIVAAVREASEDYGVREANEVMRMALEIQKVLQLDHEDRIVVERLSKEKAQHAQDAATAEQAIREGERALLAATTAEEQAKNASVKATAKAEADEQVLRSATAALDKATAAADAARGVRDAATVSRDTARGRLRNDDESVSQLVRQLSEQQHELDELVATEETTSGDAIAAVEAQIAETEQVLQRARDEASRGAGDVVRDAERRLEEAQVILRLRDDEARQAQALVGSARRKRNSSVQAATGIAAHHAAAQNAVVVRTLSRSWTAARVIHQQYV